MKYSETLSSLSGALARFQEEVRNPANTATNPQFRSKYAPLDVVINTIKPILAKNGLSFIQSTGAEGESIIVTTVLLHESGEFIESDPLVLPAYQLKKGGEKDFNAQGAGSAITYARRYSLSALLGLSSEDDDDGNTASGSYKDASSNPTPPQQNNTNAEVEKRKQEAIARANAKRQEQQTNAQSNANAQPSAPQPTNNTTVESVSQAQLKAINNLLHVVSKKKHSFEKDAFLIDVLSGYGIAVTDIANPQDNLNELTSDQAKEVITRINAEMKSN